MEKAGPVADEQQKLKKKIVIKVNCCTTLCSKNSPLHFIFLNNCHPASGRVSFENYSSGLEMSHLTHVYIFAFSWKAKEEEDST